MKQDNAGKDKVLEEYKELHQYLHDMLQRLLDYHDRELDNMEESEIATTAVAIISRATPSSSRH